MVRPVQKELGASERRACEVVGQSYPDSGMSQDAPEDEGGLIERMRAIGPWDPRYAYRFACGSLCWEGWHMNRRHVYRLWGREGLKVARKQQQKRRMGASNGAWVGKKPETKDCIWVWDLMHDRTGSGRSLKWLSIIDKFTRECLALKLRRSIEAEDVKDHTKVTPEAAVIDWAKDAVLTR